MAQAAPNTTRTIKSSKELTGAQRAALLVMYLEPETARKMLEHMSTDELEEIGVAMAEVERVDGRVIEEVVARFVRDLAEISMVPKTGKQFALEVLPGLVPEHNRERIRSQVRRHVSSEFADYIKTRPARTVATLLKDEHPQTQAAALLLMGPENAARILGHLDQQEQFEVSMRMARVEKIPGELADDVEAAVRAGLEDSGTGLWSVKGLDATARVLGRMDQEAQDPIMDRIADEDWDLSELIRRRMMLFEDLIRLDGKGVQALLKTIERATLLKALRGSAVPLQELFFANMSGRAATDLRDELELLGPTPRTEIEQAQEEIVRVAMQLHEDGIIRLPMGGSDDDMV